jgi:hypothetical protein
VFHAKKQYTWLSAADCGGEEPFADMDYAMEYDLDAANIAAAQVQLPRHRLRRSVPRRACAERLYPLLLRLALCTLHEQTRTRVSPNRVRNGPTR